MAGKKPRTKVTSLAVKRDGVKLQATWKIPSDLSKGDYAATWVNVNFEFQRENVKRTSGSVYKNATGSEKPLSFTGYDYLWCRGLERGGAGLVTALDKTYDRNRFHPVDDGKFCRSCAVKVWGGYANLAGPEAVATYKYELPRQPAVSWSYNPETATATVTVKTDEGKDCYERYDTMVKVAVRKQDGKEQVVLGWSPTRKAEWTYSVDVSPYITDLASGKYVAVKCWAYARGMAGDNPAQDKAVYKARYIGMPAPAALGAITCDKKAATGRIKVAVKPGERTMSVQLQRRRGTDGNWEDVDGAIDDGDAKALYDSYGAADPVDGERIFYRVKSTWDNYTVFSEPKRADCIYTAKAKEVCTASCGIVAISAGADGTTANVVVGWTDSTANTGCELSWSEYHNGWNMTEDPSTDTFTGRDDTSRSKDYKCTKGRTITGLEPGKTYYVRVRRYRVVGTETLYSAYDLAGKATPFATESAQDDSCGIVSLASNRTGTEVTVVVGIKENVANAGTELSWSDNSGAWTSNTAQPETSDVTAPNDNPSKSDKWPKTQTYYITGLTPGKKYYVQARRYSGGQSRTYSPYSNRANITMESAADDTCQITSVIPDADGKGAVLVIGVDEDSNNTGTIVEWSEYRHAWRSNEQPQSMECAWGFTTSYSSGWPKTQAVYLRGLEPGKTYYCYARRYLDSGGVRTMGERSKQQSFKTASFTAANDSCGIVSAEPTGKAGTGAKVVVGWTEDTGNTGTELSWSTDRDAWWSNSAPNVLLATWKSKESASADWKQSANIHLRDLEPGKTYYMRARRYLDDESGTSYSPYSKVHSFTTPDPLSIPKVLCGMVSLEAEGDGTGAVAVVGWSGDRTGCELSWSENPDAWESNDAPSRHEFDWKDASRKSADWSATGTFHITGLANGTTYYVRARSYYETDDGRAWSAYTKTHLVTPISAPASVSLSAPEAIERGKALECWWTIDSELLQTEWSIHLHDQPNKSLATGRGSLCRAKIPASRLNGLSSVTLYVDSGCGGALTSSNEVTVGIAEVPYCEICAVDVLTAQPATGEAYTDTPGSSLLLTCVSGGISLEAPDGSRDQLAGDAVWTRETQPEWTRVKWSSTALRARYASLRDQAATQLKEARAELDGMSPTDEGYEDAVLAVENLEFELAETDEMLASRYPADGYTYKANVSLPYCDLYDGGVYSIHAKVVEPVAGLSSSEAGDSFLVQYAHQAPAPANGIAVEADAGSRSVTIRLARPAGAAETDVYDIYRRTPAGYDLIAQGLALDATVVDDYAPFGYDELAYRVCTRTRDGDIDFFDYGYEMPVHVLRLDWNGGSVELPFDVDIRERFAKDFERREHADGTVNGYWDRAVTMTGSYATDVIKVKDAETVRLVRKAGSHPGAVWVRDAHGKAMQCDVELDEVSIPNLSNAVALSLSFTAMKTTGEFMPGNGDGADGLA